MVHILLPNTLKEDSAKSKFFSDLKKVSLISLRVWKTVKSL